MLVKEKKREIFNTCKRVANQLFATQEEEKYIRVFESALKTAVRKNLEWEIRDEEMFEYDVNQNVEFELLSLDYFLINKQRLIYLLTTSLEDYLYTEYQDEYSNVDYNDAEGISNKNTNKTKNKAQYANNFRSLDENKLFRDWLDMWIVNTMWMEGE